MLKRASVEPVELLKQAAGVSGRLCLETIWEGSQTSVGTPHGEPTQHLPICKETEATDIFSFSTPKGSHV